MKVNRIGPDGGFIKKISTIEDSIKSLQTAPLGSIVVRETIETTDPVTGVKTIFGQSGLQEWVGDIEPPAKPSTPIASAYLGVLSAYWDGVGFLGEELPPDFDRTDVEMSSTDSGPWFKVGELRGEGAVHITDQAYNELRYFRLVSYDKAQNASVASDVSSAMAIPVVDEGSISDEIGRIDQQLVDANDAISDLTLEFPPIKQKLVDLDATLAPLPGQLDQLETDLAPLPGKIDQIEIDLAPLPGKLENLEATVSPLPGQLDQLELDLAPLPGKVSQLETDLAPLPGQIAEIDTKLAPLPGRITDVETDLAPLPGKLTQLESDLAPLPGQLEQLQTDLAPIPGQITSIQDEIAPYPQMIDDAASSLITDARLVEGSLTKWPFQSQTIPSGAFAPGAVNGNDIANFSLAVTKLQSNRHQIY